MAFSSSENTARFASRVDSVLRFLLCRGGDGGGRGGTVRGCPGATRETRRGRSGRSAARPRPNFSETTRASCCSLRRSGRRKRGQHRGRRESSDASRRTRWTRYAETHRLVVSHGRCRYEQLVRPTRRGDEWGKPRPRRGLLPPRLDSQIRCCIDFRKFRDRRRIRELWFVHVKS